MSLSRHHRWDCDVVDGMPAELRALVQEFGTHLVHEFVGCGVPPHRIRHLIHAVWGGAREPRQAAPLVQGRGGERQLGQALACGAISSPRALRGFLRVQGFALVPTTPSRVMLDASLSAMDRCGRVTREQKHTIRLRDAIAAEMAWADGL